MTAVAVAGARLALAGILGGSWLFGTPSVGMVLLNRRSCTVKDHVGAVILATESLRPNAPDAPMVWEELRATKTHVFFNFVLVLVLV